MRRIAAALVFSLLATGLAFAQFSPCSFGVGFCAPGSPGNVVYNGPGNIVPGAIAWWGLRAFNSAQAIATANVGIFRRSSDSTTCTGKLNTAGNLDLTTTSCAGSTNLVNWCQASAGSCFVATLFDQSGAKACGGSACDLVQATAADQPALTFNCQNSQPCLTFNGAAISLGKTSSPTQAQPFTYSVVSNISNCQTSGGICQFLVSDQAGNFISLFAGAPTTFIGIEANNATAGHSPNNSLPLSGWNAVQGVFNGVSSSININGAGQVISMGPVGTNGMANTLEVGNDSFGENLVGNIAEIGVWGSGFNSSQQSAVCADQYLYWNLPVACGKLVSQAVISTGTAEFAFAASRCPHQRKEFYAANQYWVFWTDYNPSGNTNGPFNINYEASSDGVNWSSPVTLTTIAEGNDCSYDVSWDGTKIHFANTLAVNLEGLQYRRGAPGSGGAITWDAPFQTVLAPGPTTVCSDMSLAVDVNGAAWVGCANGNEISVGNNNAMVLKNANSDGTWATAAGFPAVVTTGANNRTFPILSPLANGSMQATTYEFDTNEISPSWVITGAGVVTSDGNATAHSVQSTGGTQAQVSRIDCASRSSVVSCAYLQASTSNVNFAQRSAAGVWSEATLSTGHADGVVTSPRVSFDGPQNIIITWTNASSQIWEALSTNGGASFGSAILLQNSIPLEVSFEHAMPALLGTGGGVLPFVYLDATEGLRHALLKY